jgi:Flp pilus assembly protein TadG
MTTKLLIRKTPKMTERSSRRRGAAILETGLLLPVAILMVCGAMDLARVFYAGVVVESAVRAGVQFGSFGIGKAGAISSMNAAAEADAANQGLTGVTVSSRTFCGCMTNASEVDCSTATCDGATPCGYVEATATYVFTPILPYPGIPEEVNISSSARFRVQ